MGKRILISAASLVVVVLIALIEPTCCGLVDKLLGPSYGYYKLNQQLKKHGELDARGYIEAAKKELSSLKISNDGYRKAVESFIALESILDPYCNSTDRDIMRRLANNTKGHRYHKNPDKLAPVQKTVYTIGLLRAQKCWPIWREKFQTIYSELPEEIKVRAEYLINGINEKFKNLSLRKQMEKLYAYRFTYSDEFGKPIHAIRELAFAHVEGLAENEPYKCFFRTMLRKYLSNPCRIYSDRLADVISEIRYDAAMYENGVGLISVNDQEQEEKLQLYRAMLSTHICQHSSDDAFVSKVSQAWWDKQVNRGTECFWVIKGQTGVMMAPSSIVAPGYVEGEETG